MAMPRSPVRHFQLVSLVFPLHTSQHGEWEVFMHRSIQKGLCPFFVPGTLQLGLPHGQELPKQSSPRHVSLHWDPPEGEGESIEATTSSSELVLVSSSKALGSSR